MMNMILFGEPELFKLGKTNFYLKEIFCLYSSQPKMSVPWSENKFKLCSQESFFFDKILFTHSND